MERVLKASDKEKILKTARGKKTSYRQNKDED